MTRGAIFWMLMILTVIFSLWFSWPSQGGLRGFAPLGGNLLLFVLLALLGWDVYGPAIKGKSG